MLSEMKYFYSYVEHAMRQVKYNDTEYRKFKINNDTVDFYCNIARLSEDTGKVSNEGHKIRFAYCNWRHEFFTSKDCNDVELFKSLYTCTGAMCFRYMNSITKEYDYIITLDSDVYDNLIDQFYLLSLSHEMGHCVLDHPMHQEESDERNIVRELDADEEGYKYLSEICEDVSIFEPEMVGEKGFNIKHIYACSAMIYGSKNLASIEEVYKRDLFNIRNDIANRYLNMYNGKNNKEDLLREENFKKFLER